MARPETTVPRQLLFDSHMTLSLPLLLIEDDRAVMEAVKTGLAARKMQVQHAPNLAEGSRMIARNAFSAIILDLTLPDGSGLDFARRLRAEGADVPILMLTAKGSVSDRISGLQHGADDYLCKPFDVEELIERIHAILRRSQGADRHVLQYADVKMDLVTRKVQRQEIQVVLSAREAELLAYFLRHPGQTLSRERVLQEVWGDEADDESNVLNVYVNYLRIKLEAGVYARLIHTVRGVGYVLSTREPDEPV